jgi:hypothetical protein
MRNQSYVEYDSPRQDGRSGHRLIAAKAGRIHLHLAGLHNPSR